MGRRRISTRYSSVHGRGVFAIQKIRCGERIFEYTGERISWEMALKRHPRTPEDPYHTFYFGLEDGTIIDAGIGGNSARWMNHSCAPNCIACEHQGRIYIEARRDIDAGEELFYDYALAIEARYTKQLKRAYACRCGALECRETILAPKRSWQRKKGPKTGA